MFVGQISSRIKAHHLGLERLALPYPSPCFSSQQDLSNLRQRLIVNKLIVDNSISLEKTLILADLLATRAYL